MNKNDLIISKAELYISQIEVIMENYIPYNFKVTTADDNNPFKPTDFFKDDQPIEYRIQQEAIKDLKIRIKLLFSEMATSEIFLSGIRSAEGRVTGFQEPDHVLPVMKKNLEILISHLKDFPVSASSGNPDNPEC